MKKHTVARSRALARACTSHLPLPPFPPLRLFFAPPLRTQSRRATIKPRRYFSVGSAVNREKRGRRVSREQSIFRLLDLARALCRYARPHVPSKCSPGMHPARTMARNVQFKRTRGIPKSNERNWPPRVRYQTSQRTRYFHQRRLVPESS